jgi:hypothetical protein
MLSEGVEIFDLLDRCACSFGEIEDIDLTFCQDDPHADRGVTQ